MIRVWYESLKNSIKNFWFLQDCVICHTVREMFTLLKRRFSCLTALKKWRYWVDVSFPWFDSIRFFLVGTIEKLLYINPPQTSEYSKENIREEFAQMPAEILRKIMHWNRVGHCVACLGGHLLDVFYKHALIVLIQKIHFYAFFFI